VLKRPAAWCALCGGVRRDRVCQRAAHFSPIRIFRSIPPVVIGAGVPGAKGSFDMTPAMRDTLLFSVLGFTVLYGTLLWRRLRLEQLSERVAQMRLRLFQG